jgi:hypothetical protein
MKKYEIELEGATDLLINKYSHGLNKEKGSVAKDKIPEWEEQNWKRKAYYNKEGNLILPDTYVIGSLRSGAFASGLQLSKKSGKKTISKNFIDGNLLMEESPVILTSNPLTPFDCNVKINKATIMTIRPKIERGWKVKFKIFDLNASFTIEELERLFDYCGKFIGMGDWRPKFGRYAITKIKEVV